MTHNTLNCFKVVSAASIFLVSVVFASYPILSKKFRSSTFTLGLASSFSGGLFLAAGLFHILPEANEAIGKYYKDQKTYPWVYLAAIASYYFILFIDKVCFDSHAHGDKDNNLMENIKHEFYLNLKLNITNQMNQKKVICSGHMTPLSSVVLDTDPNNKDNTRFVNDEIDEEIFKAMVSRKAKLVTSMSCLPKRKSSQCRKKENFTCESCIIDEIECSFDSNTAYSEYPSKKGGMVNPQVTPGSTNIVGHGKKTNKTKSTFTSKNVGAADGKTLENSNKKNLELALTTSTGFTSNTSTTSDIDIAVAYDSCKRTGDCNKKLDEEL